MRGLYQKAGKRVADLVFAVLFLALFWWIYLILFILVRTKLGSPVFFTQERPGRNGRIFKMVKFRSMTDERGANGVLLPDAQRLTAFGKKLRSTSLDELPELFNVLKGDMSIVGPRPLLVSYLPLYNARQARRHSVRPGITGYAQAYGRNSISWEEKFEKDVYYAHNCSLLLDLRIILKTVSAVWHREGISSATSATMEAFAGSLDAPRGKVLILANNASGLWLFRKELLRELLVEHYAVTVALPDGEEVPEIAGMGCAVVHTKMNRRGTAPREDYELYRTYRRLIRVQVPDVVLTYTIKPNVYGGYACRREGQYYIATVTGLGSAFQWEGLKKRLITILLRAGLKESACVFFQNGENRTIYETLGIRGKRAKLVSGSGVNLAEHPAMPYPGHADSIVRFLYVGRLMREKGIAEYLAAAERLHEQYGDRVSVAAIGYYDEDLQGEIDAAVQKGVLKLLPFDPEIRPYLTEADAVVLPSWHEGMSNVLMEASATARPVLASDISGCREIIDDGETGFLFQPRDADSLFDAMCRFAELSVEDRAAMGKKARARMEREFDRRRVVDAYMEEIRGAL